MIPQTSHRRWLSVYCCFEVRFLRRSSLKMTRFRTLDRPSPPALMTGLCSPVNAMAMHSDNHALSIKGSFDRRGCRQEFRKAARHHS